MPPAKNKERLRQRLHLKPVASDLERTDRFINAIELLLAQLARQVVQDQAKEDIHGQRGRTQKVS